jgi:tetratricopeptide (TPR) repeat protein
LEEEFLTVSEIFTVLRLLMSMPESTREMYERAKSLMKVGDLTGVGEIIASFEDHEDLTQEESLPWMILKGQMLQDLERDREAAEMGEKAFQIAKKLNKKPEIFDAQLLREKIGRAEEIFKTLEPSPALEEREFLLANSNANKYYFLNRPEKALEWSNRSLSLAEKSDDKRFLVKFFHAGVGVYWLKGNLSKALEFAEKSIILSNELSHKVYVARSYAVTGYMQYTKGNLSGALKNIRKSMETDGISRYTMAFTFRILGMIYREKGELDKALEFVERGLKVAEDMGITEEKAILMGEKGRIYRMGIIEETAVLMGEKGRIFRIRGDYSRAAEFLEKNIKIQESAGFLLGIEWPSVYLLMVYVDDCKNDKAETILNRIKDIADKKNEEFWEAYNNFCTAYVLKEGGRLKDRVEAERLFKRIIESKATIINLKIISLINLGDLLFTELKLTGNEEVLDEISPVIDELKSFAEKQKSFSTLAETYLLQAKISLVRLNMGDARKYITEAQQIAEKYGLNLLARKISSEHDAILEGLNVWEDFKKNKTPVSDRLKLVDFDGSVNRIQGKKPLDVPELSTEQPVCIAVFSKTGYPVFSHKLSEDMEFDDRKIGSIISLSGEMYSHSLDRLKLGDFTVILHEIDSFSLCYVFKGQSYSAGQKLNNFTEAVKENKSIIELLNTAIRTGQQVKLSDNPDLEELITNSFMADPSKFQLPFKAYKGDDPFLFVSYSHSDKLQVYPIMDYLNKSGFNVWYDEGISVSEDWKKSIVDNIDKCSAFLVFITPHIIDSKYVRREISYALDKDKKFFSVYLKDTQLPNEIQFEISGIQSMKKYTMDDSEFYSKIKDVLSPILAK